MTFRYQIGTKPGNLLSSKKTISISSSSLWVGFCYLVCDFKWHSEEVFFLLRSDCLPAPLLLWLNRFVWYFYLIWVTFQEGAEGENVSYYSHRSKLFTSCSGFKTMWRLQHCADTSDQKRYELRFQVCNKCSRCLNVIHLTHWQTDSC